MVTLNIQSVEKGNTPLFQWTYESCTGERDCIKHLLEDYMYSHKFEVDEKLGPCQVTITKLMYLISFSWPLLLCSSLLVMIIIVPIILFGCTLWKNGFQAVDLVNMDVYFIYLFIIYKIKMRKILMGYSSVSQLFFNHCPSFPKEPL